jgi:hypothetical protein
MQQQDSGVSEHELHPPNSSLLASMSLAVVVFLSFSILKLSTNVPHKNEIIWKQVLIDFSKVSFGIYGSC